MKPRSRAEVARALLGHHGLRQPVAETGIAGARRVLESLGGIGPALSARILQAREGSAFATWEDLRERVRGIGPAKAAQLSAQGLTVSGSAYAATDSDLAAAQPKKRDNSSARASVSDSSRSASSRVNGASSDR